MHRLYVICLHPINRCGTGVICGVVNPLLSRGRSTFYDVEMVAAILTEAAERFMSQNSASKLTEHII